ncbi:hypothetical protein BJ944DRAFT_230790 [Cunninghamella echinulata]|nr:hypothetical protein BJ944DRAFT_230790 [Cunninghamella echinulata]
MEEDNNILTQKGQKWIKDQQKKWDDIVQDKLYQLDTMFEEHFQWFRQHRTAKELVLTRRVLIDNDDHTTPTKRFRHDSTHKNMTKDQPTAEKIDHVDLTMVNSSLLSDNEQQSSIIKADHVDLIMDTSPIPIEIDLSEEEQNNIDNTTPSLQQHNPNNQTTIPTLKKNINLKVENPTSLRTRSLGRATTTLGKDEKRRNTLPPSSHHNQNNNNNKLATAHPNNSVLSKERKQNGRKEVIEIEDEDEENDQVILITQQQLSNSTISNNDRSKRDTINNNDNNNNNNNSEISNDSSFIGNDSSFLSRLFNFELAAGTKRSLLIDHTSSNLNKDDINNNNSNIIKKTKSPISTMTTRTSRFSRFSDDHLGEHTYHDIHNTKSPTPIQPLSSSSTLPTSTPKKSEIKSDDSTKNDLSKDHQDQTETAQENNKLSNGKEKKGGSKGEIENDKTNFNGNGSEEREMEGKETEEKEIGEKEMEEEVEVYIPSWATLPELDELLHKQAHMDADKIFGKVPPMQISQIVKFSS